MKISGILIDVSEYPGSIKEYSLEETSLEDFYKALNCSTIDIVTRKINGKVYDIVCDDEGLLRENPIVTAINGKGGTMLVGNLFICNHEGSHLTSLSKEDVTNIMYSSGMLIHGEDGSGFIVHPALSDVEHVDECM